MYEEITAQAKQAVTELLDVAGLKAGDLFVVGCSSSEVVGARIGKGSSMEAAQAVFDGICPVLHERGIYLAAQCCEHLNRALIRRDRGRRKVRLRYRERPPMGARRWLFRNDRVGHLEQPAAVENIKAKAGMDIGATLIGMHLKDVAVPVRLSLLTGSARPC